MYLDRVEGHLARLRVLEGVGMMECEEGVEIHRDWLFAAACVAWKEVGHLRKKEYR